MRRALLLSSLLALSPFGVFAAANKSADSDPILANVVSAMADGGDGTGIWLVNWLGERNAQFLFDASLTGTTSRRIDAIAGGKRPVILLNENIKGKPTHYVYYAALIAREAAEFVNMGIPESAEKRYMVYSCMAEVYFEMFGTRADLPVIGGVRDEEAAAQINLWVENDPAGGADAVAWQGKYKKLSVLITEAEQTLAQAKQDGAPTAAIEKNLDSLRKALSYYNNEFKSKETYWWTLYQPQ